jgi:hypothetical protein
VQVESAAKSANFPHFFEGDFRWVFVHGTGATLLFVERTHATEQVRLFSKCGLTITLAGQCWLVTRELASRRPDAQQLLPWCNLRVDTGRCARPRALRRVLRASGTRSYPEPVALYIAGGCASKWPRNAGPACGGSTRSAVAELVIRGRATDCRTQFGLGIFAAAAATTAASVGSTVRTETVSLANSIPAALKAAMSRLTPSRWI